MIQGIDCFKKYTNTVTTEPEGSKLPMPKLATGHDPEPIKSSLLKIHSNIILPHPRSSNKHVPTAVSAVLYAILAPTNLATCPAQRGLLDFNSGNAVFVIV
jgi:hypothetical protein